MSVSTSIQSFTNHPQLSRLDTRLPLSNLLLILSLAALKLGLHLVTAENYGLFIDELYFLASGEHLAWGYVDFPPLTALQAWLAHTLFQNSVFGIHLFPALAGTGLVVLTGLLVHELGGKRFALVTACLSVIFGVVYLVADSYLSMNSIEPLFWMGCIYVLIRLVKTGNQRLWIIFGILAGLGLLNKHTMLVFGFALILAILITPVRKQLFSRWFLLGGALAFIIFLPNLVWLVQHQFPQLEQLNNIRNNQRNVSFDFLGFMVQQVIYQNPITLPLWLGGLVYFFFHKSGKSFRFLGWTYGLMLVALLLLQGRPYYLSSIYPILLAGGAVWLEELLYMPKWIWVRGLSIGLICICGIIYAPFGLPVLPPETFIQYSKTIGITQNKIENQELGVLPQLYADRFGWPEMVEATARVYNSLPEQERSRTIIFTRFYGQAGAVDFYGPALGLPKAFSGHLNYFYWGQERVNNVMPGDNVIVLGIPAEELSPNFEKIEIAGVVSHPYAMPYENFPIILCRGLKIPLKDLWPEVKNFS